MKAARFHQYGRPEVVTTEDVPRPQPGPGQVLVGVHAAGVNPIDWKIRAGYRQQMVPLPLPFTSGGDFSGVVEAVGPDVAGFKVGDEVYGQAGVLTGASGTFAEFALASVGNIAPKPKNLGHTEAAAVALVGVSALQALSHHVAAKQNIGARAAASEVHLPV